MEQQTLKGKKGSKNHISQHDAVIVCGNNAEIMQQIAEIVDKKFPSATIILGNRNTYDVALTNVAKQEKLWREEKSIEQWKKDNQNNWRVLQHCSILRAKFGNKSYFTISELVEETNMTYKGAKDFLGVLEVLGYVFVRKTSKHKEYRLNVTAEDQYANLQTRINDMNNEIALLKAMQEELGGNFSNSEPQQEKQQDAVFGISQQAKENLEKDFKLPSFEEGEEFGDAETEM